tara:strand:+ start:413 stop:523 length:111 start_codon:yes stop_codon:yes gene_type:complete
MAVSKGLLVRAIAIPVASLREEVGPAAAARGAKGGP